MFDHLSPVAGDPILSLQHAFARDNRPEKVNLSIGLYYDDTGRIPELACVQQGRRRVLSGGMPGGYLPMSGAPSYRHAVQTLLFGTEHPLIAGGRIATAQTVGASGALRLGADLLRASFPSATVWLSNPTWGNHHAIFDAAGFAVQSYPYYDRKARKVDFAAMLACIASLPPSSIVVLHPCCHNPTGADLDNTQWDDIAKLAKQRGLIPFFDLAYQGYGEGIVEDTYALKACVAAGTPFLVSHSFSKTFSLYGERCGSLSVTCASPEEATTVLGHMEKLVRRSYSSPPALGSLVVTTVLNDAALRNMWEHEVAAMRGRMKAMRLALRDALAQQRPDLDLAFLVEQRGMFSDSGLGADAVARLREQHAIYLVDNGRLCFTGISQENVGRVARALAAVMEH